MAKKPTKEELRQALVDSYFSDDSIDDPFLAEARKRIAAREEAAKRPDFSTVTGGSSTTAVDEEPGLLRSVFDDILGIQQATQRAGIEGLKRSAGGVGFASADDAIPNPFSFLTDVVPEETKEAARKFYGDLFQEGQKGTEAVGKALDQSLNYGVSKSIAEPITDVAGSPSSLVSVLGGGAGAAVPALDVFGQEYTEARLSGLSKEQAQARAGLHAGIEGLIERIPAGQFLGKIPGMDRVLGREAAERLASDATKTAIRLGRVSAGEGLEEGVTTLGQLGVDKIIAETSSDKNLQQFANERLPEDVAGVWDATWRSIKAGMVGGAALGGPIERVKIASERGRLVSDMLAANADQRGVLKLKKTSEEQAATALAEGRDLFGEIPKQLGEEERLRAVAEEDNEEADKQAILRNRLAALDGRINQEKTNLQTLEDTKYKALMNAEAGDSFEKFDETKIKRTQDWLKSAEKARERLAKQINPRQPGLFTTEQAPVLPEPKKATDGVIPTKDPDKYYDPEGKLQSRTLDRTKADAAKAVAKDLQDQEKARVKGYNDARTKERSRLVAESRDLPAEQRIDFVAENLAKWDLENPKDKFQLPTQTKKKTQTKPVLARSKAPVQESESESEVETEEVSTEGLKSVEELKKALGEPLAQQAVAAAKTDTKAADVLNTLGQKMKTADAKSVAKLISDRNMVIVDDVSEVPGNAQERGAGFYDGDKTYIVANRVNKKNIMGEVLSIAAHEVKHAADLAGKPSLKATLGGFIGKSANDQLVKKIEGLAKVDKGVAKVVEAARKGSNKDTYALELPAYFINYARTKRDQKGAVSRLAGNVVSAVRTKFGGGDINLDDVAYMSDKLLKEVAVSGERLVTGLDTPLPMFISKGKGKLEASLAGRTYESVDGAIKYEIADDESRITSAFTRDGYYKLSDVLYHPKLYDELPNLRGIAVRFIDDPQLAFRGQYFPTDREININVAHTGRDPKYGSLMHRTLLHETQHAAQYLSGTTGGSDPSRHLSEAGKQYRAAIKAMHDLMNRAEAEGDYGKSRILQPQVEKLYKLYNVEEEKAFNDYQSVLGEHEARATADRLTLPQRRRDKQVGDMEELYTLSTGKVTDESGKPFITIEQLKGEPDYIMAFTPELLADAYANVTNPRNKLYTVLRTQFLNFGGMDRELGVMKENSDGDAARSSHRAMNYYSRLNEGISRLARRGVKEGTYANADEGRKAINDMIQGRLDAISQIEDLARREAAVGALSREHPELRPLVEAITESANQSKIILLQEMESIPNPTPKDLKRWNTIYNNLYRYSTRMYSAFQGEPGRERSRRLVEEYEKAKDALAKRGDIPAKYRESFEIYTNALKYIVDHDITIPEDEVLDSLKQDRIDQLYDTWVQDGAARTKAIVRGVAEENGLTATATKEFVRETMLEKLRQRREEISDTQYEAAAADIIRGMLELEESTSPFANYYRGFKQDRGILQEREHIDESIRKLLGEITDPATRWAVTIAKQGELVARTRLLLDMKEKGNGKWVMPAVDARLPGNEKFSAALDGDTWGPLEGWRATPEVARAIGDSVEMLQTLTDALARSYHNTGASLAKFALGGVNVVRKGAGASKIANVIYEFYGMTMNALGSVMMPIANGVVNPKYYVRGAGVGLDVVMDTLYDGKGKLTPAFEDAVRWGILDSARVQEIRRTPQEFVRQLISKKPKTIAAARKYITRGGRTVIEMFAMADAWSKITAFQQRTDVLRDFYKAEGIEKTDNEIKSEAADTIKDTNITYARTPAAARTIESLGLTTFLPYFYSVPRALTYGYMVAAKDLVRSYYATTPKGKAILAQQGLQRIIGNTVATAGFTAALRAVAAAINDDDEEVAEMKKLMTEDARFADSIYLGKDELGKPMFARLSRVDPYGPVNDALRVMMDDTLDPEQKSKYTVRMIRDLLFVNRFTKSAGAFVGDVFFDVDVKDKKTRIERVAPELTEQFKDWFMRAGFEKSDAESALAVIDSFTPGFLDTFDPSNRVVKEPVSKDAEILSGLIVALGGRLDRADPELASVVTGNKLRESRDVGRDRIADGLTAGRSTETLERLFLEHANKEWDAMREVSDVYSGMVNGLGMTPRQASEILKEKGKLTQTDLAALRQGRVNQEASDWIKSSRMLSKASMDQRTKGGAPLTPDEEKKLNERIKSFQQKMKALGYKVQE